MSIMILHNCPFCNGEAKIRDGSNDIVGSQFAITCNNDDCAIKPATQWYESLNDAINVWNTRKPLDNIISEIEEEKEYSCADFEKYINDYDLDLDNEYDDFFYKGLSRAEDIIKSY